MATTDAARDALDTLDARLRAMGSEPDWRAWLRVQSRLHRYSFGNQLLIAWQRPDATMVAGFEAWRGMGRCVRRGERAIRILAPMVRTFTERDDSSGTDVRVRRIAGFRGACVFDVAQTDGQPIPRPVRHLSGDAPAEMWTRLAEYAAATGWDLARGDCGAANGVTHITEHRIVVRDDLSPAQACKTLAHELGHTQLHADGGYACHERSVAELEAESVAFVVGDAFGLDTSEYSLGYVATWSGGTDDAVKALRACGERITKASHAILDAVLAPAVAVDLAA